ncbi:MAG: hypothetical protein ACPG5B_15085 [Chitinophagales bacterium]
MNILFLAFLYPISFLFSQNTEVESDSLILKAIDFEGLQKTEIDYLIRFLHTSTNAAVDTQSLAKDAQCLRNLRFFSTINYSLHDTLGGKKAVFECKEQKTLLPYINFAASKNGLQFSLGAFDFNSFGKGILLKGVYHYYQRHSAEFAFRNTYIRGSRWGVLLEVARINSSEPLYFDEGKLIYDFDMLKLGGELQYELNFRQSVGVAYNYLTEDYLKNEKLSAANMNFGLEEAHFNKHLFKTFYRLNRVNYAGQYAEGFSLSFCTEATFSQQDGRWFYKLMNDFRYFKRLGKSGNFALRHIIGISENSDTPFGQFVQDSYVNVRGIGNRVARGTAEMSLNVEYRQMLYDISWLSIQTVVFTDYSVLRPAATSWQDWFTTSQQAVFGGLGLRLSLDNYYQSILRIDYGFNIKEQKAGEIVIGIGHFF